MAAPTTLDSVRGAKDDFVRTVEAQPWYRGAGIARSGEGWCLRLNVDPGSAPPRERLPAEFRGIPVDLVFVGEYRVR